MYSRTLTFQVKLTGGYKNHQHLKFLNRPEEARKRVDFQVADLLFVLRDFQSKEVLANTRGIELISTMAENGNQVVRVEIKPEFVFEFKSDKLKVSYCTGLKIFDELMQHFAVEEYFTIQSGGSGNQMICLKAALSIAYWLSHNQEFAQREMMDAKDDYDFRIRIRINSKLALTQYHDQFLELLKLLGYVSPD